MSWQPEVWAWCCNVPLMSALSLTVACGAVGPCCSSLVGRTAITMPARVSATSSHGSLAAQSAWQLALLSFWLRVRRL